MERVLVTGAAGFIGSHLVERLLREGREVVGVDCFADHYARGLKEANLRRARERYGEGSTSRSGGRLRFVEGDLLKMDLGGLLRGVAAVAHLAGEGGVRESFGERRPLYVERNALATRALLEAALRAGGVASFVFASSSSVYGGTVGGRPAREDDAVRPLSPYGATKLAAEEYVRAYAAEAGAATILRYFTVYGPRQRPGMALASFIEKAARGAPVEVHGDGTQTREMTYVSDAVAATAAALDRRGPRGGVAATYNVGGGGRATVLDLVGLVQSALGRAIEVRYGPRAPGEVGCTRADLSRAARELGYEPKVPIEAGVRAQAAYHLAIDRQAAAV